MKEKISIIIPVYNTEKYLGQCIDSILSQTYTNLEIVLVNDGSKDNSLNICYRYAEQDKRIVVIDKKNGGAAESRNAGIKICTGDYIMFMDSDDYYYTYDVVEKVYNNLKENNSDIACFNYKRFYEDKNQYSDNLYNLEGKKLSLDEIIENNIYTSSVCLKLIKSEIMIDNNILFPENEIAEDIGFNRELLALKPKISFCEDAVYIYRDRAGSKTNSIGESYIYDAINIVKRLSSVHNDDENYMAFVAFQYCTLLINMNFAKVSKETKKQIYALRYLLKYNKIFKVKLIYMADKFLGTAITSKLLFIYFKMSK